ncbi:hypothetical protein SDC9_144075 [bioreactor metagenome]|uniref:Uncharacterized protein n=1 Tax=bioreactor metagenome TaxID=1076179 RepID=A0A645E5T4_9ZZZZ
MHLVEAAGERTQLIVAGNRHTDSQVVAGHALHAGMQNTYRPNDQAVEITDQQDSTEDGKQHQCSLDAAQQIGVVGVASLHGEHQLVDATDETVELLVETVGNPLPLRMVARQIADDQGANGNLPDLADLGQSRLNLAVSRLRQGAGRIALLQIAQHFLETFQFIAECAADLHLLRFELQPPRHQMADAIAAHALAAGIVDGRGNAFQLPRNEQGKADGDSGDDEEHHQHANDLARKLARIGQHQSMSVFKSANHSVAPG